jgi:hypothetical protein
MKEFVLRRGEEGRSAQKRAECRSWREQFHAAELIRGRTKLDLGSGEPFDDRPDSRKRIPHARQFSGG